jgi:periplasmic copper chaperone A
MNRKRSRTWPLYFVLTVAFCFLPPSSALRAQNADVVARDAWARMPPKSKMDTALYMVVENHSAQPKTIVGVATPDAGSAELHQMTMNKMIMVMTPVTHVSIPARGQTSFDPNNFHIMLFGLKMRPAVGDKVHVTLKLDDGTTVPVEAIVKK